MTPADSKIPRWIAVLFAAALLLWTQQIWTFYLPRGIATHLDELWGLLPRTTLQWGPWQRDLAIAAAMVGVLAIAAIGVGSWIVEWLKIETDGAERAIVCAGIGFAGLVIVASALALIRLFRPWPLRILMVMFVLVALPRAAAEWRRLRSWLSSAFHDTRQDPLAAVPLLLAAIFVFFALVAAAAPETSFDALMVYLPFAQLFLRRGTLYFIEWYRSNTPLYGTVYFAMGLSLHGETAARLLNFLTLPGILVAAAALVRAIGNDTRYVFLAQTLAVFWIASCPEVTHHASICYPDLGVALWSCLGLLTALRFVQTGAVGWAGLAGLFAGMAAGLKYSGLYWVLICGVVILVGCRSRAVSLRPAVVFALLAGSIFGPWMIRNIVNTGDPMHPSLQKYVRHRDVDLVEVKDVLNDGMNPNRLLLTIGNVIATPWRVTFDGDRLQGTIGPVLLWTIPFLFLGWRRRLVWRIAAAALPLFLLFWFTGPQWTRYFLPGIWLMAALGASAICHERLPSWLRNASLAAGILFSLVNVPVWSRHWVGGGSNTLAAIPYDVVSGVESPDQFRRRAVPGFDTVRYLNDQALPENMPLIPVHALQSFPQWFSRLPVMDIFQNGRIFCRDAKEKWVGCYTITGSVLLRHLDAAGAASNGIVLAIRRDAEWAENRNALRLEDPFLRSHFRLLEYAGGSFIYVRDRSAPQPGMRYINADLLHRWATRRDVAGDSAIRMMDVQPSDSDQRLALKFDRSGQASFEIALGDRPRLTLSMGRDQTWPPDRGSEVRVGVDGRPLLSHFFTPDDFAQGWRNLTLDLAPFSGRRIALTLSVVMSDAPGAGALAIGDPVIYAYETDEPPPEPAEGDSGLWRFNAVSQRRMVQVQLTPAVVRAGGSYSIEIPQLAGNWIDLLISRGETGADAMPEQVLRFQKLDARGRAVVPVPAAFDAVTILVRGVRRSGDDLWLAAQGKLQVIRK